MKISRTHCKVYLEGQEIKFNTISLQERRSSPTVCSISIPATKEALEILATTVANVFILYESEYVPIFEGYLTGKQFSKNKGSKFVILIFIGLPAHLNSIYKQINTDMKFMAIKHRQELFFTVDPSAKVEGWTLVGGPDAQAKLAISIANRFYNAYDRIIKDGGKLQEAIEDMFDSLQTGASRYYNYLASSFKFKDRVLAFENSKALVSLHKEQIHSFVKTRIDPLPNLFPFISQFYLFLEHIGHSLIYLSAPLYNNKSLLILPKNDYLSPIRSNTFFSDRLESASFNVSHLDEPTRIGVIPDHILIKHNDILASFIYSYPDMHLVTDGDNKGQYDLSTEEKYRGVVAKLPEVSFLDRVYLAIDPELKTKLDNATRYAVFDQNADSFDVDLGKVVEALKSNNAHDQAIRIAEKLFFDLRYSQRTFNISCPYDPNRLVGFPALYVDDALPSVLGTIDSISTTISADGALTSSITFSKPRLFWELESYKSFKLNENVNPNLDSWVDNNIYGISQIGKKVYNSITGDTDRDSSIIRYGLESEVVVKKSEIDKEFKTNAINNSQYITKILALSIQRMKEKYFAFSEEDRKSFEKTEISRKMLNEENYWKLFLHGKSLKDDSIYFNSELINLEFLGNLESGTKLGPFIQLRKDAVLKYIRSI